MPDSRRTPSHLLALGLALYALHAGAVRAQQPDEPAVAPYRAPVLALVQPAEGGTVPQDRPVVVFRFAAGEPDDPIDLRSFAVSVDDRDRTALFRIAGNDAWGPLAAAPATIELGPHELEARVCSARGACASAKATITVGPPGPPGPSAAEPPPDRNTQRKSQLVDAFLSVLRTLLKP